MKFLALLAAAWVLLLSGCGIPAIHPAPESGYTVTDDAGRQVRLARKPVRIVSTSYGTDEILAAVVPLSRIRAFCRYAGDEGITFITKEERDAVGRTVEGNLEGILAEQPDLVFVSSGTDTSIITSLTDMGIPVYVSLYPRRWEDLEKKIRGVARAVGEEEKGEEVVAEMNWKERAVQQRLSPITKEKQRRTLGLAFSYVMVGKEGTLLSDLMRRAHADNVVLGLPRVEGDAALGKEYILQSDPEVLLLPTWNFNGRSDAGQYKKEIAEDPALAQVSAVRNGRLVYVPDRYRYVNSQHAAESIEVIAKAVYPELWP